MNCLQAEEHFSGHFEDRLDYKKLRGFEAHLADCDACQHEYALFQKSVQVVQQLPQIEPSPTFMPTVLHRLAEEGRETSGVREIAAQWRRLLGVFRRPRWVFSGIIALILALTGITLTQDGLFDRDSRSTAVAPSAQKSQVETPTVELPVDTRHPLRDSRRFLPGDALSPPAQPMQHYVLKQVSYSNASTSGGL